MSNEYYIDLAKKYVLDKNVAPFEYVDGHPINVFSLLAEKKKKLFNIDKPIQDIDENDILDTLIKAIASITIDDYRAFMQAVEPFKTSLEYSNDIIGLTNYLYTFAEQAGYYDLACILNEKRHPEGTNVQKMNYASMFAITMFSLCQKAAESKYQPVIQREALPLPKLPKRPDKYIAPNNTLINAMTTKELINAGARDLIVSREKDLTSYVLVADPSDLTGKPSNMSNFERETMNAICSIWKQAEIDKQPVVIYTPASIYKAMPGGGTKPTKAMRDNIEKAFDKMMQMPLEIDATKELRAYKKISEGEKYKLKTMLLHADKHEYTRKNGKITVGWQLFTKPAIYDYAERTGQLINVEMKVMQIEKEPDVGETWEAVNINELRRDVLSYLIRRVAVIKHAWERACGAAKLKRNEGKTLEQLMTQPAVIAYDSVYAAVGANTKNRNQLQDIRAFCGIVLKYWVRIGYIDGFQELSVGRRKKSIKILFN